MRKGSLAKGISPETWRWFCRFMACRGKKRRAGNSVVCSPTVKSCISKSCLLKILTVVILLHTFLCRFSGYMIICIWMYFYAAFVCFCRVLNFLPPPLSKSKILGLSQPFWNKTFIDIFRNILYLSLFRSLANACDLQTNFKLCTREWDLLFTFFVVWLCFWSNRYSSSWGHSCRLTHLKDFTEGCMHLEYSFLFCSLPHPQCSKMSQILTLCLVPVIKHELWIMLLFSITEWKVVGAAGSHKAFLSGSSNLL